MNNLDYGVIGNCRTGALISDKGSIDWLCLPDFDSPSVFSKLLDKNIGGSFEFIVSEKYSISQKYIQDTNILSTRFASAEGVFEVIDYMPRYQTVDNRYYHPPEIHRYIKHIVGTPTFRIKYDPKLNYAKENVYHAEFDNFLKTASVEKDEEQKIYLYSSIEYQKILRQDIIELQTDQFVVLSYNQKLISISLKRILLDYERTKVYWLNWTNRSRNYKQFNDEINRSMLVLKLMSYQNSGAMLAALTTSLPESIGETRNWDYRFCWIRDASMSIETLLFMGHKEAAERYIGFIKRILKSRNDMYQIMYGIRGERELTEEVLTHLSGYENSYPVRIGNAAYNQLQNDSLGYLLDVIYKYCLYFPGNLDEVEEIWEVVRNIVRMVKSSWRKPDKSIWEFRTKELNFVFSKVMSWVALDRAAKIAALLEKASYVVNWEQEADLIKKEVLEKGWKEDIQSFSQAYENNDFDSSLLLMQQYGFINSDDERYIKTVKAIKENLMHKGLMYRYKAADDFGEPTSSFTICTFWLIEALVSIDEKEEAFELFQNMMQYANHLGLYSEDLDFETKRQLGNFPQAYSHLAFINTASLFSEEKKLSQFIQP